MRTEAEASRAISLYSDMVRRICFIHLKNYADVEDVFQEVFLKYVLYKRDFENIEHEKAWVIRVSINCCKDTLKSFFRKNVSSIEELAVEPFYLDEENYDIFDLILKLPEKHRNAIYLFYYEGYSAVEIAEILKEKENTIYTWLSRGRTKLKDIIGGDEFGE